MYTPCIDRNTKFPKNVENFDNPFNALEFKRLINHGKILSSHELPKKFVTVAFSRYSPAYRMEKEISMRLLTTLYLYPTRYRHALYMYSLTNFINFLR